MIACATIRASSGGHTMRTFQWIFLVTLTMFLGGAVIAGQGAAAPTAPPAPCDLAPAPARAFPAAGAIPPGGASPKAKMKDIMNSMMVPSSSNVWNAVATVTDATGVHESKPTTDDDWNTLYLNAVMLTEVGNLLMVPGRERCVGGAIPAQYRADFNQKAREMVEASNVAIIAAKKHDPEAVGEAGERIDVACDACHEMYQIAAGDPENYRKVLGTYKLTAEEKAAGAAEEARDAAAAAKAKASAPAAPKK
jgi:hypothetical protein